MRCHPGAVRVNTPSIASPVASWPMSVQFSTGAECSVFTWRRHFLGRPTGRCTERRQGDDGQERLTLAARWPRDRSASFPGQRIIGGHANHSTIQASTAGWWSTLTWSVNPLRGALRLP